MEEKSFSFKSLGSEWDYDKPYVSLSERMASYVLGCLRNHSTYTIRDLQRITKKKFGEELELDEDDLRRLKKQAATSRIRRNLYKLF